MRYDSVEVGESDESNYAVKIWARHRDKSPLFVEHVKSIQVEGCTIEPDTGMTITFDATTGVDISVRDTRDKGGNRQKTLVIERDRPPRPIPFEKI